MQFHIKVLKFSSWTLALFNLISSSSMKNAAILITPKVRVPVLSVQTLFTLPIASDLSKCLTKLCSFFILSTEKANAIVTAIGSPSGMATTMTVTAIMKALTKISRVYASNILPPLIT